MIGEAQEAAVLESLVPELEAEGFEVFTHPRGHLLPSFMGDTPPDAIALRPDRKLAIEVLREGPASKSRLAKLRKTFSGHKDWELRVFWVSPSSAQEPIEVASPEGIEKGIETVEKLGANGDVAPALLMAWATLEALGRALLPDKFARPQTPARLIEVLASNGQLTPSEADKLRRLAKARNRLVHGGLAIAIAEEDLKDFLGILATLRSLLASTTRTPA